jgi:hypothetical protein
MSSVASYPLGGHRRKALFPRSHSNVVSGKFLFSFALLFTFNLLCKRVSSSLCIYSGICGFIYKARRKPVSRRRIREEGTEGWGGERGPMSTSAPLYACCHHASDMVDFWEKTKMGTDLFFFFLRMILYYSKISGVTIALAGRRIVRTRSSLLLPVYARMAK